MESWGCTKSQQTAKIKNMEAKSATTRKQKTYRQVCMFTYFCHHGSLSSQFGGHDALIGPFATKAHVKLAAMNCFPWFRLPASVAEAEKNTVLVAETLR
jgi:hypothetical protein